MLVEINWSPDRKKMRHFGITLLIGFSLFGLLLVGLAARRGEGWSLTPFFVASGIGCLVFLSSMLLPGSLGLLFYRAWMGLAVIMGTIVAPVVISLLYFLVMTPIGLLLRLSGKDFMLRRREGRKTFWQPLEPPKGKESYERQF